MNKSEWIDMHKADMISCQRRLRLAQLNLARAENQWADGQVINGYNMHEWKAETTAKPYPE